MCALKAYGILKTKYIFVKTAFRLWIVKVKQPRYRPVVAQIS
jgi:hypothetical protein